MSPLSFDDEDYYFQIAEELEESEEVLRPLYELVTEHPDNTSEELLELWQKEKK